MAGYIRKFQGHVYNGEFPAGEAMPNGVFAKVVKNATTEMYEVKKLTKKSDTVYRVAQKTTLWGKNALVLDLVKLGTNDEFFVENEWDFCDACNYNTAEFECPVGRLVRMKRVLPGEQLITDQVDAALYESLAEGDTVTVGANGQVVAAA